MKYLFLGEHDRGLPQVDQQQRQHYEKANSPFQIEVDLVKSVLLLIDWRHCIGKVVAIVASLELEDSRVD